MWWAATEVKAKVVNLSLGALDTPELDPVEQAVNTLSEQTRTLFVVATGNDGRQAPVSSPGSADATLAVGRGRRRGPGRLLLLQGPTRGRPHDQPGHHGPRRGHHGRPGGHVGCSGTSMAAPHVAGAAAIMAQRHPDWTGRQLKAALMGSAAATPGATPYEQGTGRVDLLRTLAQQVLVEPAGLWAAFPWDGEGERVSTKTITYANSGDTPVTLELGTKGGEVPKLPQERLQVPAHGTASLTLYDLVDERADGLAADMGQRARRAELAKVEATFLASGVAAQGRPYFAPRFGDKPGGFQATRPKT